MNIASVWRAIGQVQRWKLMSESIEDHRSCEGGVNEQNIYNETIGFEWLKNSLLSGAMSSVS